VGYSQDQPTRIRNKHRKGQKPNTPIQKAPYKKRQNEKILQKQRRKQKGQKTARDGGEIKGNAKKKKNRRQPVFEAFALRQAKGTQKKASRSARGSRRTN